jgi:hypothetical protein
MSESDKQTASKAFWIENRTCHGRIPEIMQRWASDEGRDSGGATDMNQSLIAWSLPPDLALVLPSPSAHVVD